MDKLTYCFKTPKMATSCKVGNYDQKRLEMKTKTNYGRNAKCLTRIGKRAGWVTHMDPFVRGAETRMGNWHICYKANNDDVAAAVNTPRILISAAFRCYWVRWNVSVKYLHVVIWAVTATILEMEMLKIQINKVAWWYSYCPAAIQVVWIVVWIIWAGEISSYAC